jgi:hypothetical protein
MTYAFSFGATALGWILGRHRGEHRPVAYLLTIGLATDLARRVLRLAILAPARAALGDAPYVGSARIAYHFEQALFLAWPAAVVAATILVFHHRRPWPVAALWFAAVVTLAAAYPAVRGAALGRCYLGVEIATVAVSVGAVATWIRQRKTPEVHHVSVALVIAAEVVSLLAGPWKTALVGSWPLAQVGYAALFIVLIVLQGGSRWMSASST